MNLKNVMELGALADAVYSEHGEAMQKAIFGDEARRNPAVASEDSDPKRKMTTNALMLVAGFGAVYSVIRVMRG
jgi:hypothetical protein